MGPGSNPSWQEHSNPPGTFEHVPFPQGFPMEHSSVSGERTNQPSAQEPSSTVRFTRHRTYLVDSWSGQSSCNYGIWTYNLPAFIEERENACVFRTLVCRGTHPRSWRRCSPGCIRRDTRSGTSHRCWCTGRFRRFPGSPHTRSCLWRQRWRYITSVGGRRSASVALVGRIWACFLTLTSSRARDGLVTVGTQRVKRSCGWEGDKNMSNTHTHRRYSDVY